MQHTIAPPFPTQTVPDSPHHPNLTQRKTFPLKLQAVLIFVPVTLRHGLKAKKILQVPVGHRFNDELYRKKQARSQRGGRSVRQRVTGERTEGVLSALSLDN